MNIPEYVTVTIRSARAADLGDFRIASGMTIGRLQELLVQEYDDFEDATFWLNGLLIPPELTIADAGIWDGSVITVKGSAQ